MTKRTLITFMLTKLSIEINSFENIDFCNNSTNILNNTMNSVWTESAFQSYNTPYNVCIERMK
jgi:hypothetical protein